MILFTDGKRILINGFSVTHYEEENTHATVKGRKFFEKSKKFPQQKN